MRVEQQIIHDQLKDLHLLDMMWFFTCRMDGIFYYEVTKGNDIYTLGIVNNHIDFQACDLAINLITLKGLEYIVLDVLDEY